MKPAASDEHRLGRASRDFASSASFPLRPLLVGIASREVGTSRGARHPLRSRGQPASIAVAIDAQPLVRQSSYGSTMIFGAGAGLGFG